MNWRRMALVGGPVIVAVLVWELASDGLDYIGLGDFDPLARICLVILVLSVIDAGLGRVLRHQG